MNAPTDQKSAADPHRLAFQAILSNLSNEIRRPLDDLQKEISSLLAECPESMTEPERSQASTMLILCEEIARLTQDSLGAPVDHQSHTESHGG
jgi:hypothetical protein